MDTLNPSTFMVFIRFWSKKEGFDKISFEEKQPKRQFGKLRIVVWHQSEKLKRLIHPYKKTKQKEIQGP